MSAREANKSRKLFPLVKMTEKHGGVPIHPKVYGYISMFSRHFAVTCVTKTPQKKKKKTDM